MHKKILREATVILIETVLVLGIIATFGLPGRSTKGDAAEAAVSFEESLVAPAMIAGGPANGSARH